MTKKVALQFAGVQALQSALVPSSYLSAPSSFASGFVLSIQGEGSTIIGGGIVGTSGNGASGLQLKNNFISVTGFSVGYMGGVGFTIGDTVITNLADQCNLTQCWAYHNGSHGFLLDQPFTGGLANSNANVLLNCNASYNSGDGYKIDHAWKNSLIGCTAQVNVGKGFRFTSNSINNKMFGGDQDETNTAGNIANEAGATGNCFFGCDDLGFIDAGTDTTYINRLQSKVRALAFGAGTDYLSSYRARTAFTPTIAGSTVAGVQTYSVQQGYYIQIGNQIQFWITVYLSAKDASTSGYLRINGLPAYSTALGSIEYSCTLGQIGNLSIGAGYRPLATVTGGSNYITFYAAADNTATAYVSSLAVSATTAISVSGTYAVN